MSSQDDEIKRLKAALAERDSQLASRDAEIKQLNDDVEHMLKKNKDLEKRVNKAEKARDEARKERDDAEKERDYYKKILECLEAAMMEVLKTYAAGEMYTKYEKMADAGERLTAYINYCKSMLLQNTRLKKFLFGQSPGNPKNQENTPNGGNGSDKPDGNDPNNGSGENGQGGDNNQSSGNKPNLNDVMKNARTDEERKKKLLAIAAKMLEIIENKDSRSRVINAMKQRQGDDDALNRQQQNQPSPGRQKSKGTVPHFNNLSELEKQFGRRLTKAQTEYIQEWVCPICGSVGEASLEKMVSTMLDSFSAAGLMKTDCNGTFTVVEDHPNVVCKNCGYNEPAPDDNPAVLPGGHKVSLILAIEVAICMGWGFPINAFRRAFLSEAKLGNSTMIDAVWMLTDLLWPLYEYCNQTVDCAPAAAADESTINVTKDGITQRLYMLLKLTQPGVWPPAFYFYKPDKRSAVKELVAGLKCQVLFNDAYKSYSDVDATHQLCLAHLAVKIWEVFEVRNPESLGRLSSYAMNYTETDWQNFDLSKDENALLALSVVYRKLACVFAFETEAAKGVAPQDGKTLYENRQRIRTERAAGIMDDVNIIFDELKVHYAVQRGTDKKNGRPIYQAADPSNPICAPIVYWANSDGAFLSFLGEPMTSADNLNAYYAIFRITQFCPQMAA